jgi:hypothetical protein
MRSAFRRTQGTHTRSSEHANALAGVDDFARRRREIVMEYSVDQEDCIESFGGRRDVAASGGMGIRESRPRDTIRRR